MSTDDLTARARAWATQPLLHEHYGAALVSELANEVDRLRTENERLLGLKNDYHAQYVDAVDARVHAEIQRDEARAEVERLARDLANVEYVSRIGYEERDAARAALERVRGVATNTSGRHPSTRILNPQDILNALEGES